jgi:hypothetical protein
MSRAEGSSVPGIALGIDESMLHSRIRSTKMIAEKQNWRSFTLTLTGWWRWSLK